MTETTTEDLLRKYDAALGATRLRYCPWYPHPKQEWFLMLDALEVFYGGAAGPGKSVALLMAALQYVDVPGYHAVLFRRTYRDLALPGALMDVAAQWLTTTDARWKGLDATWTFPSGATLTFAYLSNEGDKRRYAGAAFQFIGFDECTDFTESQVLFLYSRLRQPDDVDPDRPLPASPDGLTVADVPLRFRLASNPGGPGHDWVDRRYGLSDPSTRHVDEDSGQPVITLAARAADNPSLNWASYLRSMAHLPEVEQQRLIDGDWAAKEGGTLFHPERIAWHDSLDDCLAAITDDPAQPAKVLREVRFWDMAGTEVSEGEDPDYTVGTRLAYLSNGQYLIRDVVRFRYDPGRTKQTILATAMADGRLVQIRQVQDPGSAGKHVNWDYQRALRGFNFGGIKESGDKQQRAWAAAATIDNGNMHGIRGEWVSSWLDEVRRFPKVSHDDQVDSLSGGYNDLAVMGTGTMRASSTRRSGLVPMRRR